MGRRTESVVGGEEDLRGRKEGVGRGAKGMGGDGEEVDERLGQGMGTKT